MVKCAVYEEKYGEISVLIGTFQFNSAEEALKRLSDTLFKKGYVSEGYAHALIEREKEYPTGLEVPGYVTVALPHAHIRYTLKPVLLIGLLETPIEFGKMDSPSEKVMAEVIVLLALKDLEKSSALLKRITSLFSREDFVIAVKNKDFVAIREIVRSTLVHLV
ncbi:MAG: hypothetical protein DRO00_09335 [Thermoproteota archaeon]|nr:MAG: hypothetical protein DRO00_09335 [Candidatus Korarchaeota archaeon]